jgi:hypothetical protein
MLAKSNSQIQDNRFSAAEKCGNNVMKKYKMQFKLLPLSTPSFTFTQLFI